MSLRKSGSMATFFLCAIWSIMAAASSSNQPQLSAAFDASPEWVQKTFSRARTLSFTKNQLTCLPKAMPATKPVGGASINKILERVDTFPLDAQRRVADRFSPWTLKDATKNLEHYIMYIEGRPVLLLGSIPLLVPLGHTMILIYICWSCRRSN
jgi:hypothetical protein